MEIIGDDKKLRALFSETGVADAQPTPSFTSVWHRAQARSLRSRRAFSLSLAAVTAVLAIALGSLAVWSMFLKPSNAHYEAFGILNAPDMVAARVNEKDPTTSDMPAPIPQRNSVHHGTKVRIRASAQTESLTAKNNTTKTTTIDNWQSPTAALLTSSTDEIFKSLPQLNENANELKSALPAKSNEKER